MPRARIDPALGVRVVGMRELGYDTAAALGDDRPRHVRAASGLAHVGGRLAVVQDDAAFIAFVGTDVSAIALPRGAGGRRRFEIALGNKMEKLDLEACLVVRRLDADGEETAIEELWAFGSGSAPARDKIVVIAETTRVHDAAIVYRHIRDELHSEINLEGAALHGRELWLCHRGNTGPADPGPAIVRFERVAFSRWLAGEGPVPHIVAADYYDLGAAGGSRLGFTDAVDHRGHVFYLAAAEASANAIDDGAVLASQLGVIQGDRVRACELVIDGAPAKAEGIAFDPRDDRRAWIAIDPDDVDEPARLYEIELVGPW